MYLSAVIEELLVLNIEAVNNQHFNQSKTKTDRWNETD